MKFLLHCSSSSLSLPGLLPATRMGQVGRKYFNLGKRFLIRITCLSPPLLPLLPEGLPPLQEHGGVVHPRPGAHQDRNLLLNLRGFFWGEIRKLSPRCIRQRIFPRTPLPRRGRGFLWRNRCTPPRSPACRRARPPPSAPGRT